MIEKKWLAVVLAAFAILWFVAAINSVVAIVALSITVVTGIESGFTPGTVIVLGIFLFLLWEDIYLSFAAVPPFKTSTWHNIVAILSRLIWFVFGISLLFLAFDSTTPPQFFWKGLTLGIWLIVANIIPLIVTISLLVPSIREYVLKNKTT